MEIGGNNLLQKKSKNITEKNVNVKNYFSKNFLII